MPISIEQSCDSSQLMKQNNTRQSYRVVKEEKKQEQNKRAVRIYLGVAYPN